MASLSLIPEFPDIYYRIASLGWLGFKGAYDVDTLNDRINRIRKICRNAARKTDDQGRKQKLVGRARMYAGLQMGGFAEEFIRRADGNPNSIYALSQRNGFHRAIEIRRERAAREMGTLRRIR